MEHEKRSSQELIQTVMKTMMDGVDNRKRKRNDNDDDHEKPKQKRGDEWS